LGVSAESRVGVCARALPAKVLGQLAVLKAGGAYLPLDPGHPRARLAAIVQDAAPASGPPLVLTEPGLAELFAATDALCIDLDPSGGEWEEESAEELPPTAGAALAVVVYTSGSTGRPKGVGIGHAAILNLIRWHWATAGVVPGDRAALIASPGFDAAILETWPHLAAGASLQ